MTEQERLALLNKQNAATTTTTSLSNALKTDNTSQLQTTTPTASSASKVTSTATTATPSTSLSSAINLPGVSETTKQAISTLMTNGYVPSTTVEQALAELNKVIASKPGAYQSQYDAQISDIMDKIMNRGKFSYDFSGDPTYNQYKDQYTQQGNLAMQNTMGQAAALTGGYGNSYASTAGNQAYQSYLSQLNNIVPELQSNALSAYNNEGTAMQNNLSMLQSADTNALSKYQNEYSQWQDSLNLEQNQYDSEKQYDYNNYNNQLDYWSNMANQENSQYNSDSSDARSTALSMLSSGLMPSADMLTLAGISTADAKAIYNANHQTSSSGSSRSSGSSGSSRTSAASKSTSTATNAISAAAARTVAAGLYATYKRTGVQPNLSKYPTAVKSAFNSLKTPTK